MASTPLAPDIALANALPELREAELRLRAAGARIGITYRIAAFGGIRTEADTVTILAYRDADYAVYVADMKRQGKTPLAINDFRRIAPFGSSYHNYGGAFDVEVTSKPATMSGYEALTHLGGLAGSAGLRWGASFGDRPHFELPMSLSEVRRRWIDYNTPADTDESTPSGETGSAPPVSPPSTTGLMILGVAILGAVVVALARRFRA